MLQLTQAQELENATCAQSVSWLQNREMFENKIKTHKKFKVIHQ